MTYEELIDSLEEVVENAFSGSLSKENILEGLMTVKEQIESGYFDEKG